MPNKRVGWKTCKSSREEKVEVGWRKNLIACKSDLAKLPKINFSLTLLTDNSRKCQLDLGRFLAYLMTLIALNATADVNQAAANVNLGVKAITDVKKSAKATADV